MQPPIWPFVIYFGFFGYIACLLLAVEMYTMKGGTAVDHNLFRAFGPYAIVPTVLILAGLSLPTMFGVSELLIGTAPLGFLVAWVTIRLTITHVIKRQRATSDTTNT